MIYRDHSKLRHFCLVLVVMALLLGGCAEKYSPQRYQSLQSRFGAIALSTNKKVYLCPAVDSLPSECRKSLDPKFTPWQYATDAFEEELKTSGVTPQRPAFAFGPGLDSLKQAVTEKANKSENAVYLGTDLLWLSPNRWTVDAALFSPKGDTLFQKRGICVIFGLQKGDDQEVAHMAIRQILADPKYKQALKQ